MSTTEALMNQVVHLLDAHRADLEARYHQVLRETLFSNRSEVRPAMLRRIAQDEAAALSLFLHEPQLAAAMERGQQLCRIGLSEETQLLHS